MKMGQKIKECRKKKAMTGEMLAAVLRISIPTLSLLENNKLATRPSPKMVIRLANFFDDTEILSIYLENNIVYQQAKNKGLICCENHEPEKQEAV